MVGSGAAVHRDPAIRRASPQVATESRILSISAAASDRACTLESLVRLGLLAANRQHRSDMWQTVVARRGLAGDARPPGPGGVMSLEQVEEGCPCPAQGAAV